MHEYEVYDRLVKKWGWIVIGNAVVLFVAVGFGQKLDSFWNFTGLCVGLLGLSIVVRQLRTKELDAQAAGLDLEGLIRYRSLIEENKSKLAKFGSSFVSSPFFQIVLGFALGKMVSGYMNDEIIRVCGAEENTPCKLTADFLCEYLVAILFLLFAQKSLLFSSWEEYLRYKKRAVQKSGK